MELERDKRERDAREREMRERELRDLELREKMKQDMELKPGELSFFNLFFFVTTETFFLTRRSLYLVTSFLVSGLSS